METLVIHPKSAKQSKVLEDFFKEMEIPFEKKEKPYNPDFVKKIEESRKQAREGKTIKIELGEIWK